MKSAEKRKLLQGLKRIGLSGFSGPNQAMLEFCLSSAVDCELVNTKAADIVVYNGDQAKSADEIEQELNETFLQPVVVISIKDDWDGHTLVKKPHTSDDLLHAIRSIDLAELKEIEKELEEGDDNDAISEVDSDDLDFIRGGEFSRKRQGEALKQKLIRGNLTVKASDRLVQQLEAEIKQKEALAQQAQLDAEKAKRDEELAKLKQKKLLLLKKKKLAEKKKQLQLQKAKQLKLKKQKALAAQKAKEVAIAKQEAQKKAEQDEAWLLQCCGNTADVDLSRADERRRVFHNPEGTLLVTLQEVLAAGKKTEQVQEVTGLPGQLFYLPDEGQFLFDFADDFLNQLALTRFGYGELALESVFKEEGAEVEIPQDLNKEDSESLIWKIAIWTARGRLFTGMDPDKLLQLSKQPDFNRFIPLPKGKEIGELWSGHKMSALDVARILDVPQRYVFAFMSGASALGWLQA